MSALLHRVNLGALSESSIDLTEPLAHRRAAAMPITCTPAAATAAVGVATGVAMATTQTADGGNNDCDVTTGGADDPVNNMITY